MRFFVLIILILSVVFFINWEKEVVQVSDIRDIPDKIVSIEKDNKQELSKNIISKKSKIIKKKKVFKKESHLPEGRTKVEIRLYCEEMYAQQDNDICYRIYMLCEKDAFSVWRREFFSAGEECFSVRNNDKDYDRCLMEYSNKDLFNRTLVSCMEENSFIEEASIVLWEKASKKFGFNFSEK